MMVRETRSHQRLRQERTQRLLYVLFGISAVIAGVIFCFVGFQIVARGPREIPAGRVSDYTDNQPRRFAVEKLEVSSWVSRRPAVSDDIIFVLYDATDDTWRAFLGLDMRTGCFLSWDEETGLFVAPGDPQCLGSRYTPDGRYHDGMEILDPPPRPMAPLRVEIRDNQVIVLDSLLIDITTTGTGTGMGTENITPARASRWAHPL